MRFTAFWKLKAHLRMKMIFKKIIRDYDVEAIGIAYVADQIEKINKTQNAIFEKISSIETKLSDLTRAVATLALVQASLVREISDVDERESRSKSKPAPARKTGNDFTN